MNTPTITRRDPRLLALVISLLLSNLALLAPAHALEICANSVTLLNAALSLGEIQSTPFKIKIVQGTYLMDMNLVHNFSVPTTVEGGYTVNCVSRVVDPANTVINIGAGHQFQWAQGTGSPTAEVNVDGVTFSNADQPIAFYAGKINFISSDDGSVTRSHMRFTQLSARVSVNAQNDSINMTDVLFDHISTNDA